MNAIAKKYLQLAMLKKIKGILGEPPYPFAEDELKVLLDRRIDLLCQEHPEWPSYGVADDAVKAAEQLAEQIGTLLSTEVLFAKDTFREKRKQSERAAKDREANAKAIRDALEEKKRVQDGCSHRRTPLNNPSLVLIHPNGQCPAYLLCQTCQKQIFEGEESFESLKIELEEFLQFAAVVFPPFPPVTPEEEALYAMPLEELKAKANEELKKANGQ